MRKITRINWIIPVALASMSCAFAEEVPLHASLNANAPKPANAGQEYVGRYAGPRIHIESNNDLKIIKSTHPDHYKRIIEIITGIQAQHDELIPKWLRAKFDAKKIYYAPILSTTYSPRRNLLFDLGDVSYEAEIIVNDKPKFILAK